MYFFLDKIIKICKKISSVLTKKRRTPCNWNAIIRHTWRVRPWSLRVFPWLRFLAHSRRLWNSLFRFVACGIPAVIFSIMMEIRSWMATGEWFLPDVNRQQKCCKTWRGLLLGELPILDEKFSFRLGKQTFVYYEGFSFCKKIKNHIIITPIFLEKKLWNKNSSMSIFKYFDF